MSKAGMYLADALGGDTSASFISSAAGSTSRASALLNYNPIIQLYVGELSHTSGDAYYVIGRDLTFGVTTHRDMIILFAQDIDEGWRCNLKVSETVLDEPVSDSELLNSVLDTWDTASRVMMKSGVYTAPWPSDGDVTDEDIIVLNWTYSVE